MQKLPYREFSFTDIKLDEVLQTDDNSDFGYWVICNLKCTNEGKDKTTNFHLLPLRIEVENNDLDYKQRPPSCSKSGKLKLDQNSVEVRC